jgi:hypothetical protein
MTTIKELKALLKNRKKPEVVNKQLKTHLSNVVNELIDKPHRKEAIEILNKSTRECIGEFLYYYYSDIGNVACLVLDKAKDELVAKRLMKKGKNGSFGGIKHS